MSKKLELLDKKLALRTECENLIKNGESEQRKLNSIEDAKLTELRKQMSEIDTEIANIDKQLEEEKRVADEIKNNIEKRNNMENTKNFSLVNEIRSRIENPSNGLDFKIESRAYDVTGGKETGDATVPTDIDTLLTPLYDNQVLGQFTWLTNLQGNISIPTFEGNSVAWSDENGEALTTDSSITAIKMSPKRLTAQTAISKQLLFQSNANIEQVVREDIQNALIDKLQKTLLGDGEGSDNQPAGLFHDASTMQSVTFANLCDIEETVEEANVVNTSYIVNPFVKNKCRQAVKQNGTSTFLFENGQLNGQNTQVTNASAGVLYGDLKQVVIGQWDGIEITIDAYTLAPKGMIKLIINSYWDAAVRRPEAVVAKKYVKA